MELRYSNIVSSIYICMMYSSGMPILYPIMLISFFLMYWIDKFLCNFIVFNIQPVFGGEINESESESYQKE